MCYDASQILTRQIKNAIRMKLSDDEIAALKQELKELEELDRKERRYEPKFHVTGFQHPELFIYLDEDGKRKLEYMEWGLLPFGEKLQNQTLNARAETLLEKRSYKVPVQKHRGILFVDAFYEHHHKGKRTFPYRIKHRDDRPLPIAVLWNEYADKETGELQRTFSIVTVEGNALMAEIHNDPKGRGPRMPLILPDGKFDEWLKPWPEVEVAERLKAIAVPYPEDLMKAYTVGRLRGKEAVGNVEEVERPVHYADLNELF